MLLAFSIPNLEWLVRDLPEVLAFEHPDYADTAALFKMATVSIVMVLGENHNKLVYPQPNPFWLALIWTPCVVLSPRSMGWLTLCIEHTQKICEFPKWLPVHIFRSQAKSETYLFFLIPIPSKWHQLRFSSMHGLQGPLAAYFSLQKQFFSGHLQLRWLPTMLLVIVVSRCTSLLHTIFEVASARRVRVISICKSWCWHCCIIWDGSHHKCSDLRQKPEQTCSFLAQ